MNENNKRGVLFGFIDKIKNNKKIQYFLITILIIIATLIILFGFKNDKAIETSEQKPNDLISVYVSTLDTRLSDTLSKVNGAGKVCVVITIESGMETVFAMKTTTKETSNGVETEQTPIVVNGKTVVVKELYPKIIGVLIVAEGANNISVMTKLQQATVSLLNINLDQIEILSMK